MHAIHNPRIVEAVRRDGLKALTLFITGDDAVRDEALTVRAVVVAVDFIRGEFEPAILTV